ncbi:ABC transporter substrate-binding protein [Nonomuraea sp. B12E4]|uniref:ABC transporter substrate-binding protein n=1 Tax=Nonomuraea sp. B12E4 TaxID=3153564 RepID=UPI00325D64E9
MNLGTDPGTINPYKTTGGTNRQIFAFSYDTLVARTPDGSVVPQLATSWKVSPDQVTYTLRKGVTCEDGTPLTPSDVAADFDYIKDPKTLSPWVSLTIPLSYTATADDAAGTVTIKTKTPFGFLLEGAGSLPIVCPSGLKNPGSIEHASNGTGPYKVTSYVPGDHYTLDARPGYAWGPNGAKNSAAGSPKTVKIAFVQNESTSANQLLSGQVNAAQITGPDRTRLDANTTLKRFDVPVMVGELNLNEAGDRVLADPRVRLAMAAALDRSQVTKVGTSGLGQVADNMMVEKPVSCPGDETTGTLPAYNPGSANQTLDVAGYTKGADGIRSKNGKRLTVNLIYQVGAPQTVSAVELIGQQLKAVGIGTNLKGLTQAAFLEALYTTQDFDAYYSGINLEFPFMMTAYWGGATPDKGGRNTGSIVNEDFDALSAKALAASGAKGCELWKQAHQALLKRADVLPISVGDRPFYTSKASLQTVGLFAVPTSLRLYQ